MPLLASFRRRQPERLLGKLGRKCRRATSGCQLRGVVEESGDVAVWRFHRQRQVTGAEERVFDDSGDASVNAPPLLAEVLVDDRRQERVDKTKRSVLALD